MRTAKADEWLAAMLADPAEELVHSDVGYASGVVPEGGSHPGSGGGSRRYVNRDVAGGDITPVENVSSDPPSWPPCCCFRPGDRLSDGRCGRCYGTYPQEWS